MLAEFRNERRDRVVQTHLTVFDQHHDRRGRRHDFGERRQIEHRVERHGLALRRHGAVAVGLSKHDPVAVADQHHGPRQFVVGDGLVHDRVDALQPLEIDSGWSRSGARDSLGAHRAPRQDDGAGEDQPDPQRRDAHTAWIIDNWVSYMRRASPDRARRRKARGALLREPIEDVDQFAQAFPALILSLGHAVWHARVHVMPEDTEADAVEGSFGGRQLLKDFDTKPGLLHHPPDSPDLPFNPIETRDQGLLLWLINMTIRRSARLAGCDSRKVRGADLKL
jgi:hypothetical protein